MNLHTETFQIQKLLSLKKKYIVPRYQREFSWSKNEISDLFNDIIRRLKVSEEKLTTTEYFFGSMIFEGDLNSEEKDIYIIDGQQRLTAITILLSVLYKKFCSEKKEELSQAIWKYIIDKDDDGKNYTIFVNETPAPYFQYKVQMNNMEIEPSTEEEDRIYNAYRFFEQQLEKKRLQKIIKEKYNLNNYDYIEILKIIRDQLLRTYIIAIWTKDANYTNLIFEIMNAKGKELASVDLIKNKLFEILNDVEPTDVAYNMWTKINKNLNSGKLRIPFSVFFRQYWFSHYKKISDDKLYSDFDKKFKSKDQCLKLLMDLEKHSKIYKKIVAATYDDINNKKQYYQSIQCLKNISDVFNVVMPRMMLMSLYCKCDDSILKYSIFQKAVKFIEMFHFIYNGVCSNRTNKLDKIYCVYSQQMVNASSEDEIKNILRSFSKELINHLPLEDEYIEKLKKLKYSSKRNLPSNMIAKYYVNEIENILSKEAVNKQEGSIEHIFNEDDEKTLYIENLVLLELKINNSIPGGKTPLNKQEYYEKSNYSSVKELNNFMKNLKNDEEVKEYLKTRIEKNSKLIYEKVVKYSF